MIWQHYNFSFHEKRNADRQQNYKKNVSATVITRARASFDRYRNLWFCRERFWDYYRSYQRRCKREAFFSDQARSQGGASRTPHPLNLPKGPLFATKRGAKMGLCGGLGPKGPLCAIKWAKNEVLWGELGPKGPLSEVPHTPKIESGYGPVSDHT